MNLTIREVDKITPKGANIGLELITWCPLWTTKVNVKKSCIKCREKISLSYNDKVVDCALADRSSGFIPKEWIKNE